MSDYREVPFSARLELNDIPSVTNREVWPWDDLEPGGCVLYHAGLEVKRKVLFKVKTFEQVWDHDPEDEEDYRMLPVGNLAIESAAGSEELHRFMRPFTLFFDPELRFGDWQRVFESVPLSQMNAGEHCLVSGEERDAVSIRQYDEPYFVYSPNDGQQLCRALNLDMDSSAIPLGADVVPFALS